MNFEDEFVKWLGDSLKQSVPKGVRGFSFNLFVGTGIDDAKFGVELVGASEFDEIDPDWPCSEVWAPSQRMLAIPDACSGSDWQHCLEVMKALVLRLIQTNHQAVSRLMQSEGIGMGFVDGDLLVLWKAD